MRFDKPPYLRFLIDILDCVQAAQADYSKAAKYERHTGYIRILQLFILHSPDGIIQFKGDPSMIICAWGLPRPLIL